MGRLIFQGLGSKLAVSMNSKKLFLALSLALQVGFAADWPIYRGNVFFTGNNDEVAPTNTRIFYTVKTDAKIFYPIVSDGVIFFTTGAGCLYAIDEETGELRFRVKMQSPAIRQSVIYGSNLIAADTQWLYDYDKKSGTILWARKDDDNGIYTTPTLADNTVFYGSRKRLFAKRLDNGHDLWDGIPLTLYGGFANVYGNLLFIPTRDPSGKSGALAAVNTTTGKTQWQKSIPYAVKATAPVIYNETVYLTVASNLMAFKAATGELLFDEGHGDYIVNHPVFSDASIFLPLRDGTVSVADLKTGKRKSHKKTEFKSGVSLLLIRDNLYVTGADIRTYGEKTSTVSKLVGYDLNSGKLQFEFESPTPGGAGPVVASKGRFFMPVENVLYVIGQDGLAWFGKEKLIDFSKDPCPDHPEKDKAILIADQTQKTNTVASNEKKQDDKTVPLEILVKDKDSKKNISSQIEVVTRLSNRVIDRQVFDKGADLSKIRIPKVGETELLSSSDDHMDNRKILRPEEKEKGPVKKEIELSGIDVGKSIVMENINFAFDRATVLPETIAILDRIRDTLLKNKNLMMEVRGYTDNVGDAAYNQKLSEKRADAVKEYLVKNGIFQERIRTKGFGKENPIADNATEEGQAKNRRTEFFILRN